MAVNCTWPLGKSIASALGGLTDTDCSWRGLPLPHPVVNNDIAARTNGVISSPFELAIGTSNYTNRFKTIIH